MYSPALQAPITLVNPPGSFAISSDVPVVAGQGGLAPSVGTLSAIGGAVRMALAMATFSGSAGLVGALPGVVSGLVTPVSPAVGSSAYAGAAPILTPGSGGTGKPLGINLNGIAYYSTEQPFLNVLKMGGNAVTPAFTGWYTASATSGDTGEEQYLVLDSDGYATTLTVPGIPGGQKFTFVKALMFLGTPTAPGTSVPYPAGTYRIKFIGQGTLTISGDASATFTNTVANTYTTGTFTVTTPSKTGLTLVITAINSGTDYPRDISVVDNSLAASYDGGAIFHPSFLAAVQNFKSFRFMDWLSTNNELVPFNAAGNTIAAGANGCALASAWAYPTQTKTIYFNDGEKRTGTFTAGSTAVDWTAGGGALAKAISNTFGGENSLPNFYVSLRDNFANRSKPSNAFWSLQLGVPLEICVALCNTVGAHAWINVPLTAPDADITSMNQLVFSGTGMQAGFSPLSSGLTCSFELSNEVWNSGFKQYHLSGVFGGAMWPTQTSGGGNFAWSGNWFGMRTAQMANICSAVWGASFSRCIPVLGATASNTFAAQQALRTTYWSGGPASNAPIKAIAIAPYIGDFGISAADITTMVGQPDGGYADFFATLSSQVGASGITYSSVPAGGWLNQAKGWVQSHANFLASSYPSIKLLGYEGGYGFVGNDAQAKVSGATLTAWRSLVIGAARDARIQAPYTTWLENWKTIAGATLSNLLHHYFDVGTAGDFGNWGLLESVMQPLSGAGEPYRFLATQNYIQNG